MRRWTWKQWAWSVAAGTAIAAGTGTMAHAEPPKKGDTITLSFPGQPERKVPVIQSTKKPDGSIETEVKDPKTGETFTIFDEAPEAGPQTPPAGAKAPAPPAPAKPVVPSAPPRPVTVPSPAGPRAAPTPMPEIPSEKAEKPRDRRFFGRLFSREKSESSDVPAMTMERPEDGNRRGLLDRIFGRKSEPGSPPVEAMPARPILAPRGPAAVPQPVPSAPATRPVTTGEPPRVMPPRPSSSIPLPLPAKPVVPSGPQSIRTGEPGRIVQVGYTSSRMALSQEIRPFAETLANDPSPSARLMAARALAQGRHASSDEVKAVLFQAVQSDLSPTVRADCIGHLCKLGYFNPAFLDYVRAACNDASAEVRDAANAAIGKLTPSGK
jgi:hypothetical protein